jgi:hypothetical protein
VLLQRRAQGASPLGLRGQVVDLQVQVRLHLLDARTLGPHRGRVVGLPLEAQTGAFLPRSLQPDPFGVTLDFLPAQQGPVEVGRRGRIGSRRRASSSCFPSAPDARPDASPRSFRLRRSGTARVPGARHGRRRSPQHGTGGVPGPEVLRQLDGSRMLAPAQHRGLAGRRARPT